MLFTKPLIARGFSRYIKAAVQRVGNVELKSYFLYEGDILHFENEYSPHPEKPHTAKKLEKATAIYDLAHHLNSTSPAMQKLVNQLRDRILQLPSVEEKLGQKSGITYRTTKSFTRLEFRKTWIQVLVRDPKYPEASKGLVRDISSNEWGYAGTVEFKPESDQEYVFKIVKASYNSTL